MELTFEWDEEKDRINRQKHGISFETASYVFRDEYYIDRLISARLAMESERRLYYDQNFYN
ncbi:MAG: BrnT family toxin [Oscillospiraceae bacterium]|nr:BrnT family toxin [Oscillospiraceae bacterium]